MLNKLRFLTAGESHGKGLTGILEGVPAGLPIDEEMILAQLARRQKGYGRGGRMAIEKDQAEIFGGVRHGKTLGSPISLIILNKDWRNWLTKMAIAPVDTNVTKVTLPRPGHADLAGIHKFDFEDIRNVLERSSARETTMRVALGSICRKLLSEVGIEVASRVIQIHSARDVNPVPGSMTMPELNAQADQSPVRCLDSQIELDMIHIIDEAAEVGDTVGGVFEVMATGSPFGLGSYLHWDKKLNAALSAAVMSINGIKGVEIGAGMKVADQFGSRMQDEIGWRDKRFVRFSNNAGGIEGGMTNTQPIRIQAAMKPIPTLRKPLRSVDIHTKEEKLAHIERSDTCAVPAASVIAESMVCFILADALLEKFGGDTIQQLKSHMDASAKF